MSRRILIAVAWPYANGPLHLGHLAGCYLPADIFARYHRIKGNQVLMVSGSDQHGTPITIRAEQEGLAPDNIVTRYHDSFLDTWKRMGVTFDLFTTTRTSNHSEVVHDIFLDLYKKDLIYADTMRLPYCSSCARFLPDRYIEGTCPHCDYARSRGDQCEMCGKTVNPEELIDTKCRLCSTAPEFRESEHLFLRLSRFQDSLLEWVSGNESWRANVLNFTKNYLKDGLKDRAISRDISWGIKIPIDGFESKRIYVWFEAVIGYLSASKEWATNVGMPGKWREFWEGSDSETWYFIGKDNIPFHSIIWPAILMGYGGLNLPHGIPANEFLSLEGRKFSTSENWALWAPDYLDRFEPDPLRYYLSVNMPETGDSDFSWEEFVRRNNDELVATYGNLVHRVLSFTYRNFDKQIPTPSELQQDDKALIARSKSLFKSIGESIEKCKFKLAINQAMSMAQEANRYLDSKAPWKVIKVDREGAATTLWVTMSIINCLKVGLYPFLPFSSRDLHELLGFSGLLEDSGWTWEADFNYLPPGQALKEPKPLFIKFDDSVIGSEIQRLRGGSDIGS